MFILICLLFFLFWMVLAAAFVSKRQKPASLTERLQSAQVGGAGADAPGFRDQDQMDKSLLARVILPTAEKLSGKFAGVTPKKMVEQSDQVIAEAGLTGKVTGVQVTTISWMLTIGLPAFLFLIFMPALSQGNIELHILGLICLVSAVLGYRLPIGLITSKASKRKHEIQLSLPFTMDLISISVESGMAFDGAMQVVAERTNGALSEEMRRTLREINLGISRTDALANMSKRIGLDDLKSFITAVNYISKLGGSLVDVIRIQTEAMRVKRRQRAEKKANQAPVKIMIPLVLFIFPCLFIIILGPAAVRFATGGFSY
ncbi:MAG: type II secretion system F family protein [Verrucomicrobiota bacterium]